MPYSETMGSIYNLVLVITAKEKRRLLHCDRVNFYKKLSKHYTDTKEGGNKKRDTEALFTQF